MVLLIGNIAVRSLVVVVVTEDLDGWVFVVASAFLNVRTTALLSPSSFDLVTWRRCDHILHHV